MSGGAVAEGGVVSTEDKSGVVLSGEDAADVAGEPIGDGFAWMR